MTCVALQRSLVRSPLPRVQRCDRAGCFVLPGGVSGAEHLDAPVRAFRGPLFMFYLLAGVFRLAADRCLGSARIAVWTAAAFCTILGLGGLDDRIDSA